LNRKTNWEVFIEDQLKEVYQKLFDRIFFLQNKNGYRNESEAEEIVHDTCVRCIEKMNQFDGRHFLAWARTILERIYIDKGRRKKNYDVILTDIRNMSDAYLNVDVSEEVYTNIAYETCLKKLSEKQYQVFYLQINGRNDQSGKPMTTDRMSKILGMPLGTLLPLLARAKKSFSNCLHKQLQNTNEE